MAIPGLAWTLLAYALPLLAGWLVQYYGGFEWAVPVAALLTIAANIILKAINVNQTEETGPKALTRSVDGDVVKRTKMQRFVWG